MVMARCRHWIPLLALLLCAVLGDVIDGVESQPADVQIHDAASALESGAAGEMMRRETAAASVAEDHEVDAINSEISRDEVDDKKMIEHIDQLLKSKVVDDADDGKVLDQADDGKKSQSGEEDLQGSKLEADDAELGTPVAADELQKNVDRVVFKHADTDGSNHLEDNEMKNVLHRAGVSSGKFDWHDFDSDKDGRLSEHEFLDAGPAAAKIAVPTPLSMLEEHVAMQRGPGALFKVGSFESHDKDGSGHLEEGEANELMKGAGVDESSWRPFDHDGDGTLTRSEFDHPAETSSLSFADGATRATAVHVPDADIFDEADVNKSNFLEKDEITKILASVGVAHTEFDWHHFDEDKDGRLSEAEFIQAGPAVAAAATHAASESTQDEKFGSSLLEVEAATGDGRSTNDFDNAGFAIRNKLRGQVDQDFLSADIDQSGFLEPGEVQAFGDKVRFPENFDWSSFDSDKDGKLSREELLSMAASGSQNIVENEQLSLLEEGDGTEPMSLIHEDHAANATHADDGQVEELVDRDAVRLDFKEHDVNKNGFLEESEVNKLLHDHESLGAQWRKHDTDKDGRLSESELFELAKGVTEKGEHEELAASDK